MQPHDPLITTDFALGFVTACQIAAMIYAFPPILEQWRSERAERRAAQAAIAPEQVVSPVDGDGGGKLAVLLLQLGNALLKLRLFLLQRRNARLRRRAGLPGAKPGHCDSHGCE